MGTDSGNTTLVAQVRSGMLVTSADGERLGNVWQVHAREAEVYVEVRPHSFWNTILSIFSLPAWRTTSDHLFLPAKAVGQISGKHLVVHMDAKAARECIYRPAWIVREKTRIQPVDYSGFG